jgi:nitrite reductase/ring-hydroxylating ferredoxin subunit/uncharacterized membrane protein
MSSDSKMIFQGMKEAGLANQAWEKTPPPTPPLRHLIGQFVASQTWIDTLAQPLQDWLCSLYGQPGQPGRKVKSFLNGTWLGHNLHPVLTDIPIGTWMATTLLDVAWLTDESRGIARGSDMSLMLGLLGALGAAVTGSTDWSDLNAATRRLGLVHGLLNYGITAMNITSLVLRLRGKRRPAIVLSSIAYGTLLLSAYLGGELVFAKGIGVNHEAFEGGPDEFTPVMDEADLVEGKLTLVNTPSIPVVMLKQGGTIYAIGGICTHMGCSLALGTLEEGGIVQCPCHGSRFRMSDGSVVNSPAVYAESRFDVRVRDGKIEVRRLDQA